ncbi:MAG TPA: hypothetical protein VFY49_01305 [Myxococcota bacterium]|nr:hypothetical protein [Myxococcota bacterium]
MWIAIAHVSLGLLAALALALRASAEETQDGTASWLPPGAYRLEMRVAANASLPWFGHAETVTTSTSWVEIDREGGKLVQRHQVCEVHDAARTRWRGLTYPRALVESLPTTEVRPVLEESADGLAYQADLGREWLGTAPGESLPRKADDPRVQDTDGDGRPGVTLRLHVLIGEAELLVAQRTRAVLKGTVVSPGRVTGRVEMREFAQAILEASPHFLRFTPDVHYDPERSTFELVRDDDAGCAARAAGTQAVAVNPSGDRVPAPR